MFNTVIWDLGGVLVDWDPRYMYKTVFRTSNAMEYFLSNICTPEWNEEQDGGKSFEEATNQLSALFPHYSPEIKMFYSRWEEMLAGPIHESVEILQEMKNNANHK